MNEVKLAEKKNINELVKLLNIVTLNLHDKGINQWEYPWDCERIKKDVEEGNTYEIIIGHSMAATFSIKDVKNPRFPVIDKNSMYLYRIALLPSFQGNGTGFRVIKYAMQISRSLNKTLYLDCWAENEKLKSFYSNAGFSYCGNFPEKDYMVSVFKL